MTYGEFMAEEQKARMQAIKDSEFRAANDDGEPATDLTGVGPSSLSPPETPQGWELCETCRATGWIPDEPDGWDVADMSMSGCPDCTPPGGAGGLGFVPPARQVEAGEWALWESDDYVIDERVVRAVLLAAAKAERKERG